MVTKRLLVLMMVAVFAMAIGGCGGSAEQPPMEDPSIGETTELPPPVEEPAQEEKVVEVTPPALNDVFFDFDQYNLTTESKGILERNANELRRVGDARIVIEGHCDERGTKSYNLALGEKRANAARDYLVALGVGGSRITVVSYGKERPFDMGHSETSWARNRRAHMVLK